MVCEKENQNNFEKLSLDINFLKEGRANRFSSENSNIWINRYFIEQIVNRIILRKKHILTKNIVQQNDIYYLLKFHSYFIFLMFNVIIFCN